MHHVRINELPGWAMRAGKGYEGILPWHKCGTDRVYFASILLVDLCCDAHKPREKPFHESLRRVQRRSSILGYSASALGDVKSCKILDVFEWQKRCSSGEGGFPDDLWRS